MIEQHMGRGCSLCEMALHFDCNKYFSVTFQVTEVSCQSFYLTFKISEFRHEAETALRDVAALSTCLVTDNMNRVLNTRQQHTN